MGNIYHEWNGTVLTVTSDSGTSSADLKGAKGDTGIRGPQGPGGGSGSGGGVSDYNELTNIPFTYVENLDNLDELTDGTYYTFSSLSGFSFIYVTNDYGFPMQMIWTPTAVITRYKQDPEGEWETQTNDYVIEGMGTEPIQHVDYVNFDELTQGGTYSFVQCGIYIFDELVNMPGTVAVRSTPTLCYQTIYWPDKIVTRRGEMIFNDDDSSYWEWEIEEVKEYSFGVNKVYNSIPATLGPSITFNFYNSNEKYYVELTKAEGQSCSFEMPTLKNNEVGSIVFYAKFNYQCSFSWYWNDYNSDDGFETKIMRFYNDETPEIGVGYYEFRFDYDPNLKNWFVEVIKKGTIE